MGIESRPRSGRRYSSVKATHRYYDSDSDSDDESSSDDSSDDESSSDDSSDDSDSDDDDYGCPSINQIMANGIDTDCLNGRFFINGKEIKNVDSTDRVDVIGTEVRVNGEFIGTIPSSNNRYKSKRSAGSKTAKKKCPDVMMSNCKNVSRSCINGQLYINKEKINVKATDSVLQGIEPRLRHATAGRFSSIKPTHQYYDSDSGGTINECPRAITKNGCINVSNYCKNGQFYINGEKINNVKSTDRVEIISNNLKINGKFITYIPPHGNTDNFRFDDDNDSDEEKQSESESFGDDDSSDEEFSYEDNDHIDGEEEGEEDSDGDDEGENDPIINMFYSDHVFTRMENGKLFVNDFKLKNYKPTDRILIDHNNLYINGKFIRYIEPYMDVYGE
ncbi:hypothetical protein U1Q18_051005 [Sarracenia purpurea var. burkii]